MPSPIGHALGGLAVAWVADLLPPRTSLASGEGPAHGRPEGLHYKSVYLCVALAVLPDADLLLPIAHRTVTHSFAAVAAVALLMIVAGSVTGKVTARFAVACVAAYASHLLLDWLQIDRNPPSGIQLLWPFSSRWFISDFDLFRQTARQEFFTAPIIRQNAIAVAQECLILLPILALIAYARLRQHRQLRIRN